MLSLITGVIAMVLAYLSIRKSITKPDNRLLERWQAQSVNGELARVEEEGTFDKAEIARGTAEGQKPFATQAQIDKELAAIPSRREVGPNSSPSRRRSRSCA